VSGWQFSGQLEPKRKLTEFAHAFAEVIPERQIANHANRRQWALRPRYERPSD
jgi:hypothetical protein